MRVTPQQAAVVGIDSDNLNVHEGNQLILSVDADADWRRRGILEVMLLPGDRTILAIESHECTGWHTHHHHDLVFVSNRTTGITIDAQGAMKLAQQIMRPQNFAALLIQTIQLTSRA